MKKVVSKRRSVDKFPVIQLYCYKNGSFTKLENTTIMQTDVDIGEKAVWQRGANRTSVSNKGVR